MSFLKFSQGNAKLKQRLIFSLPAGKTCPGAVFCKSFAVLQDNGKRKIQDGKQTEFRCFAASSEVQYDAVYNLRANNMELLMRSVIEGSMVDLINASVQHHRKKNTKLVRIHESGDFFSRGYLNAWIEVAKQNPDLKFYCYSKSLDFFLDLVLPENFYLTASYGGKFDHLIDQGLFPRFAKVYKTEEEAMEDGLEVDHDDSHCFGNKPFALLVHGTQPKGSEWSKAIAERRKANKFTGYSSKTAVS
ncbi:MAG: hypothetical protein CL699_07355 [Chloroflexi bacterium]|nr:hypothetical protein [Chloroflexota bacterium]|tara:strand:- start:1947 stop:2684 length:738 start_codon:yes stop_codon:yes gene_type:complete